MTLLSRCPVEVILTVLSYCENRVIPTIDTAHTNNEQRASFLSIFIHPGFSPSTDMNALTSKFQQLYLVWVSLRHVHLRSMVVTSGIFSFQSCFPDISLVLIEHLTIKCIEGEYLEYCKAVEISNRCPKVNSITLIIDPKLTETTNDLFLKLAPAVLNQLTELKITSLTCMDASSVFHYMSQNCRNLRILSLYLGEYSAEEDDLVDLISKNIHLQNLTLDDKNYSDRLKGPFSTALWTHCHNLRTVSVKDCYEVTLSHIADILSQCTAMESFKLHSKKQPYFDYSCRRGEHKTVTIDGSVYELQGASESADLFRKVPGCTEITLISFGLTDSVLNAITDASSDTLASLWLSNCAEEFTFSSVERLLNRCLHLADLGLGNCNQLTNDHFVALFPVNNPNTTLRSLGLSNHYTLTADTCTHIIRHSQITVLNVFRCFYVRNAYTKLSEFAKQFASEPHGRKVELYGLMS